MIRTRMRLKFGTIPFRCIFCFCTIERLGFWIESFCNPIHSLLMSSPDRTVVQNSHKSRHEYWATCFSVRSIARSAPLFACSAPHASLARSAAPICSLACSLTPELVGNWMIRCLKMRLLWTIVDRLTLGFLLPRLLSLFWFLVYDAHLFVFFFCGRSVFHAYASRLLKADERK